ncbi:MAG TPA: dockerin type I domain-containing protein [Fimbriimonadaceae bacterium]|nr:dockerin type I domain-containing protein [Fimbriimonadaceae bacterium]HRJ97082.1 dockerin type I domain-containing protein [Fimbriimonadaceae bacterium]
MRVLVSSFLLAACAGASVADTLSVVLTVDDAFDAYISTDPAVQGAHFLSSPGLWYTNGVATVGLNPGVINYLQIKGRDIYGNPQMFIGQFTINGVNFRFENQTGYLLTNTTNWLMTVDGFGGTPEVIRDIGPNGTGPWGMRSGIDPNARFIWTQAFSSGNRYFTARIVPVSAFPVIDGRVQLLEFDGLVAGRTIDLTISNGVNSESGSAVLDAGGHFNYSTTLPAGSYVVGIKSSHWLRKNTQVALTVAGPNQVNTALVNGDVDGDNEVSIGDYSQLSFAFNSEPGDTNWNAEADLNGDDGVDIGDYAILSAHFGEFGDE